MSPEKIIYLLLLLAIVAWAPYFFLKSVRRQQTDMKDRIGSLLILFGVFAWVPYFALKVFANYAEPATPFLIVHLSGVMSGAFLRGRGLVRSLLRIFRGEESK